jgi:hypothetical protein
MIEEAESPKQYTPTRTSKYLPGFGFPSSFLSSGILDDV